MSIEGLHWDSNPSIQVLLSNSGASHKDGASDAQRKHSDYLIQAFLLCECAT